MRHMLSLITCKPGAVSDELVAMRVAFADRNNDAWEAFWAGSSMH